MSSASATTSSGIRLQLHTRTDGAPIPSDARVNPTYIFTAHIDGEWPTKTKELCHYDLQPFDGVPVGIPRSFDEKTKKYRMHGYFCSWSCAYAYLQRENNNRSSCREKMNIFASFIRSVLNKRPDEVLLPPPLEHLAQLVATRNSLPDAVAEWRSHNCRYVDFRPLEGVFVPIAQVFEDRAARERTLLRQDRQAQRMEAARAKPLIQTREAQRLQSKIVREKRREQSVKRNAIDELLGVKMHKRPKASPGGGSGGGGGGDGGGGGS